MLLKAVEVSEDPPSIFKYARVVVFLDLEGDLNVCMDAVEDTLLIVG